MAKENKNLIKINLIRHTGLYFLIACFFMGVFIERVSWFLIVWSGPYLYTPFTWNGLWLILVFFLWISITFLFKGIWLAKKKNRAIYANQLIPWNPRIKIFFIIFIFLFIGSWFFWLWWSLRLKDSVIIFQFSFVSLVLIFLFILFLWYRVKIEKISQFYSPKNLQKSLPSNIKVIPNSSVKSSSWIVKWIYLNGFYLSLIFFVAFLFGLTIIAFLDQDLSEHQKYRVNINGSLTLAICSLFLCFLFAKIFFLTRQLKIEKITQKEIINWESKIINHKIALWAGLITLWIATFILLIFYIYLNRFRFEFASLSEVLNMDSNYDYNFTDFWIIFNFCFFGGFAVFWTFCLGFLFLREAKIKKEINLSLSREKKFTKFDCKNKSVLSFSPNH